jgi:hypothetical protein
MLCSGTWRAVWRGLQARWLKLRDFWPIRHMLTSCLTLTMKLRSKTSPSSRHKLQTLRYASQHALSPHHQLLSLLKLKLFVFVYFVISVVAKVFVDVAVLVEFVIVAVDVVATVVVLYCLCVG